MGNESTKMGAGSGEALRRFAAGVIVICIMISLIGSTVARVSLVWSLGRAMFVFVGVGLVSWVCIRSWTAWQELHRHQSKMSTKDS